MEEFSSLTVEELEHEKAKVNEASYKQDFWKNLEAEWKKEVEDNAQSAEWLDDFDAYVPYEQYEFVENNPLKDTANCLEEGKKKLSEGREFTIIIYTYYVSLAINLSIDIEEGLKEQNYLTIR